MSVASRAAYVFHGCAAPLIYPDLLEMFMSILACKRGLAVFVLLISSAHWSPAWAQSEAISNPYAQNPTQKKVLLGEIEQRNHLMRNLEELCDDLGARLTGSQALRQSQHWAMAKLRDYGLVNVHEESYDLGKAWTRSESRARLLNANQQKLDVEQKAWTSASVGKVRGEVVILQVKSLAEFELALPSLAGKIVLALSTPTPNTEQKKNFDAYSREYNALIQRAKIAAILFVSERDGNMLDMSGGPNARYKHNVGIISKEHAHLLQRLIARGVQPKAELQFGGQFSAKPVLAYNVIAEIRGTVWPDEMVIIGVHQDSWDLGNGATDNGVGVVLALEVARALRASPIAAKRSLRVVLFSGEEQGLLGSKAYVKSHADELTQVQAMLTVDSGAGRIIGFPDMQVDHWYSALSDIAKANEELRDLDIAYGISNGSDHSSFFEQGIPAFSAMQEPLDYLSHTWHSQVDTVDHVKPEYLLHNAKILSLVTWGLLNAPKLAQQKPALKSVQ